MAPVSSSAYPSRSASSRAVVDFPAPAGPSMATIRRRSCPGGIARWRSLWPPAPPLAPVGKAFLRSLETLAVFTEAGRKLVAERLVGVERLGARDERLLGLLVVRIREAALDGADRLAGLVIVKSHALGAELRIDDVDVVALADRLVRALGLASPAVDAFFGDVSGHRSQSGV